MRKRTVFIFSILVIVGFMVMVISARPDKSYTFIYTGEIDDGKVWDCTNKESVCEKKNIEFTIENCDEWYTHESIESLNCEKTAEGIDQVAMLADEANYVTSAFTEDRHSVEVLGDDPGRPGHYKFLPTGFFLMTKEGKKLVKTWDLEFLPDGSYLVTQKNGRIVHYKDGVFEHVVEITVLDDGLAGLMGLAIDPNYSENNYIYVHYAASYDNSHATQDYYINSRISRFKYKDGVIGEEYILLGNLPASKFHAGGQLEFGPDGKLYATIGDAEQPAKAQDINFLGGKIIRLNSDGTVPDDNPFENYVYSSGHRNAQGLAWHPETMQLYSSEHGDWRYDEINLITPGGNYGWPSRKCDELNDGEIPTQGDVTDPIRCFKEWTLAPSGAVFVDDVNHPWHNNLFVAALRGKHLRRFVIVNNTIVHDEIFYFNKDVPKRSKFDRRIRDVEFYNGSLWVLSDWSGVAKITPEELTRYIG